MIQQTMDFISRYDPEVGASIQEEFGRERRNIELIASENIVSEAVMLTMGTCLTNKMRQRYWKALLWWLLRSGCHGGDRPQAGLPAVRLPVCQCAAPLRGQRQPGGVFCPAAARRHSAEHVWPTAATSLTGAR